YFKSEKDKKILAIMFLIAGFLFLWAAGEEISWGQRILNLKTPDILIPLNDQNEINIHNINKKFFQRAFQHSITLVILLSTIAFFLRRTHFFKIKIPDVFLIYSFLFIPVYNRFKSVSFEYLIGEAVFLFFLFYFLKKQNIKMLLITILSICFNIVIVLVHYKFDNNFNANDTPEVREYIFSFLCFIYSLYLFNDSLQNKHSAGYSKKASIEN
ncbi:MAG: hypothetical protein JXN64_13165, partial [Spirochaetes bacterium]|nr:hypothetical protein [Spirochaetota bacterium]